VTAFDAITADPARIALGTEDHTQLEAAAATPDPQSPACQAALSEHRTALMFQVGFTALVFIVAFATAISLVIFIYRVADTGWDPATALSAVAAIVTGGASVWLSRRMREARKVERDALADVGTYCGIATQNQVK
jgi:hypothetical protein